MEKTLKSKINEIRLELSKDMGKSGKNTYSKYDYFQLKDFMPNMLKMSYGDQESFNVYVWRKNPDASVFSQAQVYLCERPELFQKNEVVVAGGYLAKISDISGNELTLAMARNAVYAENKGFLTKLIRLGDLTSGAAPVITVSADLNSEIMGAHNNVLPFFISGYCER